MKLQPAAFLRTTLPLDLSQLDVLDSGRYHSIWLPDHMVSFWPDSIWTPEFTDLATTSPSPHRHLDGLAVAAAAAVLTRNVPIATSVVDTVRRHPSSLAQTALTIDHLSRGRFILGLGSGETENTVPYGFDFSTPVSRFEESLQVIRLLWESDGPVELLRALLQAACRRASIPSRSRAASPDLDRRERSAHARHHRPLRGRLVAGRRVLARRLCGPVADHARLGRARRARSRWRIVPAFILTCLIGDDAGARQRSSKRRWSRPIVLQIPAETHDAARGFDHPLGDELAWLPGHRSRRSLTRERILAMLAKVDVESHPCDRSARAAGRRSRGSSRASSTRACAFPRSSTTAAWPASRSPRAPPQKVREAEDELMRLVAWTWTRRGLRR